ncbi:MAG TPA: peptide chain release factor N(5)-glutamine methyltransferase [Gemmatimonadales bacterium]|nr:peptide chain release factor N(5)-glutamine methyltransferase [Gemmatimonadales bacterium]
MPETSARPASIATVGAALERAAERLGAEGVAYPRREAGWFWELAAGLPAGQAWLAREARAAGDTLRRFDAMVSRRLTGMPFAYAAGQMAFRRLTLTIDDRALIPRPETEGLVELVLAWAAEHPGGWVADIGTGSGCIALSLALEGRFDRIVATEPSPSAAALARANAARSGLPVDVLEGDLLEPLRSGRYRAIVSNPPYLTDDEWTALDHAVRAFEPRLALTSGVDGLDATRALIAGAAERLEPGGLLALEIDERRAVAVRDLAHAAGWDRVRIVPDLFGRPRYALMHSRGRTS